MKSLIFAGGIIVSALCFCNSKSRTDTMNSSASSIMNPQYSTEKKKIADCFIENVEYFRKNHRYDFKIYVNSPDSVKERYKNYYIQYPGADWDPANFFEPYATRYSLSENKYVASSIPTSEQLTVTTDTMVYSKDKLFCVALLILQLHYDTTVGLEQKGIKGREYDAKVVIGYRSNTEQPFDIYPLVRHSVIGFESYDAAAKMLNDLYFHKMKGEGGTGSVYEGEEFKYNIGDEGFFDKSPYFKKHASGLYNFQMYRHLGKDSPFQYVSCGKNNK